MAILKLQLMFMNLYNCLIQSLYSISFSAISLTIHVLFMMVTIVCYCVLLYSIPDLSKKPQLFYLTQGNLAMRSSGSHHQSLNK